MIVHALTMNTRTPMRMVSVESRDRRSVKPRVNKDLWMRPSTSIRAIGPAFSEASRLRIDGKAILQSGDYPRL